MTRTLALTPLITLAGCSFFCPTDADTEVQGRLAAAVSVLENAFATLDNEAAQAAASIGTTGLDSDATRQTLRDLCAADTGIATVDCSTISLNGILTAIEPEEYQNSEGVDISDQTQVQQVLTTKQPVLSDIFTAVEGLHALDFEYPAFDTGGTLIGSVSVLFTPESLGELVNPLLYGSDYALMIEQTDGTVVYDDDPTQIGANTFTDPIYANFPEVIAIGRQITTLSSGTGTYQYTDTETGRLATKQAWWDTLTVHTTQLRVVLIKTLPN